MGRKYWARPVLLLHNRSTNLVLRLNQGVVVKEILQEMKGDGFARLVLQTFYDRLKTFQLENGKDIVVMIDWNREQTDDFLADRTLGIKTGERGNHIGTTSSSSSSSSTTTTTTIISRCFYHICHQSFILLSPFVTLRWLPCLSFCVLCFVVIYYDLELKSLMMMTTTITDNKIVSSPERLWSLLVRTTKQVQTVWVKTLASLHTELLQCLCDAHQQVKPGVNCFKFSVCARLELKVACHRKRMHVSCVCIVRMCMNQCVWVLAFIIIHKATQKWSGTSPWSGEIRRQSVARKRQNFVDKVHSLRVTFQCQVDQWYLQRNNVFQWNTLSTLSRNKEVERRREWERIQWILARPVKVKQRNFVGYRQDWLDFENIKVCTHLHPMSLKKKKKTFGRSEKKKGH